MDHFKTIQFGQHQIQQYDIWIPLFELLHHFSPVHRSADFEPLSIQRLSHEVKRVLIVIDDEHSLAVSGLGALDSVLQIGTLEGSMQGNRGASVAGPAIAFVTARHYDHY